MSCQQFSERFPKLRGEFKDRAEEAVAGCERCDGNIPINPDDILPEDDVDLLVDEIADIVKWDDAGFKTDWSCYDFSYQTLFKTWREAEKEIANLRESRIQAFLKSWSKE